MKKFKIFFYPIYLLIGLVTLYYSIDILTHQQGYMERVTDFATLRKLPQYLLTVVVITSSMMVIELLVENVHLYSLRKKVSDAEEEVLKLKAKLYDQSDENPEQKEIPESVDVDEPSDTDEESDYLLDDEKKD